VVRQQVVAAVRFSGQYTPQMGRTHLADLRRQLLADGLIQETDEVQWMAAQVGHAVLLCVRA